MAGQKVAANRGGFIVKVVSFLNTDYSVVYIRVVWLLLSHQ